MSDPGSRRTLDRLWAGWRSEYVTDAVGDGNLEGEGSIFTRIVAAVDRGDLTDETAFIVARGEHVFAILNAYPYGSGHLLVMPYREVLALDGLTDDEATELWQFVRDAVTAILTAYEPHGVNVGFNLGEAAGAGVPDHLHGHVLPRWSADNNFMTTIAEARVMPETLSAAWRKLTDSWPD